MPAIKMHAIVCILTIFTPSIFSGIKDLKLSNTATSFTNLLATLVMSTFTILQMQYSLLDIKSLLLLLK